jgi:hypothetical protein
MRKRDVLLAGLSLLGWIIILFVLIVGFLLPNTVFFEYTTIKPIRTVVGQTLSFQSVRRQSIPLPLHFTDDLFCSNGNPELERTHRAYSTGGRRITNGFEPTRPWTYDEKAQPKDRFRPIHPAECELVSQISLCLIYPVCKLPQIVTTPFTITEAGPEPEPDDD